jgi:flagellar biosynthesis/type III secretory pathway chaperone
MEDKKQTILNQIDRLDRCISELEITANNFYEPQGELLEGWNLLLLMRDKLNKFKEKQWVKYSRLK